MEHAELTDDEYNKLVVRFGQEEVDEQTVELNDANRGEQAMAGGGARVPRLP